MSYLFESMSKSTLISIENANVSIDVQLCYYPQEYSDNPPYSVYFLDWRNDPELDGVTVGEYWNNEEARPIFEKLVDLAEAYKNSLLNVVYSFKDYLEMCAEGIAE